MDKFLKTLNDGRGKRMLEVMQISDERKKDGPCSIAQSGKNDNSKIPLFSNNVESTEQINENYLNQKFRYPSTSSNNSSSDNITIAQDENVLLTTVLNKQHPNEKLNFNCTTPIPKLTEALTSNYESVQIITASDILEAEFLYENNRPIEEVIAIGNECINVDTLVENLVSKDNSFGCFTNADNSKFDIEDPQLIEYNDEEEYIPETSLNSISQDEHKKDAPNIERQINEEKIGSQEEQIDENPKPKKRVRNESLWAKNVKKMKVNKGDSYVTKSGTLVEKKTIKTGCGDKCKIKCIEKVNLDIRQTLLKDFLSLSDINRKRDFISKLMDEVKPKYTYKKDNSHRSANIAFHFIVDGKRFRVCKKMFTDTFCITSTFLTTVKKKTTPSGFINEDLRGKHMNQPKVDPLIITNIFDHINSFARIESHYCRADTKREYIDGDLDLAEMYRLYKASCIEKEIPYAKKHKYEEIFNTKFNIGFFIPKKDQCAFCAMYNNSSDEEKIKIQDEMNIHRKEKELSRQEKKQDIQSSKNLNSDITVACFDLQAVVQLPKGQVSSFYYKRKLNAFNFTIFDATFKQGYSYIWHEGCAKRGAIEIASFVYDYIKEKCNGCGKSVVFYSDNCSSQNKNFALLSMYLYAVQTLNISSITHKYLIVGHTQNEGDTMHSVIEKQLKKATKKTPLYVPSQLVAIVQVASKDNNPFIVKEIDTQDVLNWKDVTNSFGNNFQVSTSGEKIVWANVKVFQVRKEFPKTVFYKTSYDQKEMMSFNLDDKVIKRKDGSIKIVPRGYSSTPSTSRTSTPRTAKSKVSKHNTSLSSDSATVLPMPAYQVPPGISILKKADLISLCEERLIPKPYHQFFQNLRTTTFSDESRDD